jgi:ParB/Sulfiredoxin domain
MTLRVSALSTESPDMSEPEFTELLEDIRRQGQLVPIVVNQGEIIDGRKRFRACQSLGIEPKIVELNSTGDPEAAAYSLNILRTHYTVSQRAMFAARRATLVKGDVRTQTVGKNAHRPQSAELAAKSVGTSKSNVKTAKLVRRLADPAVVAAVEAGKLNLHAAQKIVRLPKNEQAEALQRVLGGTRGKSNISVKPTRKINPRKQRIARTLLRLEFTVDRLVPLCMEKGALTDMVVSRLQTVRTKLSRIIRHAELAGLSVTRTDLDDLVDRTKDATAR